MDAKNEVKSVGKFNVFPTDESWLPEYILDKFPRVAKELAQLIGLEATLKLIQEEGGNELKLPETTNGNSLNWHRLVSAIGMSAAERLVKEWPSTSIYIPMCLSALRILRTLDAQKRYDSGESFDSIRRKIGVSRSYLFRLLKQPI